MRSGDEHGTSTTGVVDWTGVLKLAAIAGVVAALTAVALHGVVGETTLVVSVIVLATMASWFQIEHPRPAPQHLPVRRE
ncbi:MAG: hypothetical protein AB7L17_08505 [Ilumatobacteraceae bacterium]